MNKEVFLKAAELIESGKERFACHAIMKAVNENLSTCEELIYFERLLKPNNEWLAWLSYDETGTRMDDTIHRSKYSDSVRIIALCLAYEMAKSEGY